MKKRYVNNNKKFMIRFYFFETMAIIGALFIVLSWLDGDTSSLSYEANALALLISIGFDKVLNGKDELFTFKRIKNNENNIKS